MNSVVLLAAILDNKLEGSVTISFLNGKDFSHSAERVSENNFFFYVARGKGSEKHVSYEWEEKRKAFHANEKEKNGDIPVLGLQGMENESEESSSVV